jgi:ABC-2 type transport system permease protein
MRARLVPLLRKELRQIRRSRGAVLSSTLLPLLLMMFTPGVQYFALSTAAQSGDAATARVSQLPPGMSADPMQLFTQVLLPLFFSLTGLVTPSVAATYIVVGERERRSLDLLLALPIRVSDILGAKLLAMLVLTGCVVLPMYVLDAVVLVSSSTINLAYAAQLLLVLIAAVTYAIGQALLLALLARDLRTAQNLNGALLLPIMLLTTTVLFLGPEPLRLFLLTALLLIGAILTTVAGMRFLTFVVLPQFRGHG